MSEIKKISLKLNNDKCIQECFRGAGGIYHAYTFRADYPDKQYTEEERNIELERVKNMELKIARTFFDLVAFKDGKWDWDCEEMQALYKWLDKMQEFGVEVALNAAWWISGHVFANKESPLYDKDPKIAARNYGNWVSEVVRQLIEIRGYTHIKYLIILTEPNDGCWTLSCEREDLREYRAYELCARAADRQLRIDGRRHLVKLVGPNAGIPDDGDPTMLEWVAKRVDDSIDIYSAHRYMDYIDEVDIERETYNGKGSLKLSVPGYRAQQYVKLEPNTEYELEIYAKAANGSNLQKWQRGFLFGAFETSEVEKRLISAGSEGVSSLTENSVSTVSMSEITCEWKKYSMTFNTLDKDYAYIGIYHDVLPFHATIFYDAVSLHKVGDTEELIENGDFEDRKSTAWLAFKGGIGYVDEKLPLYNNVTLMLSRYLRCIPEGKEFWFDEYNARFYDMYTSTLQGIALAEIQAAFLNSGVNCNLLWSLFDQRWPFCKWDGFDNFVDGDHRFGITPNLKRTLTPYPAYYAFTLISKYLGDHKSKIYEGDAVDSVCVSLVKGSDGNYSVLAVNSGKEAREINLSFSSQIGRDFARHLYDSAKITPNEKAEIIGIDKVFKNVTDVISDVLPANSMAIYTTRMD
jgi:hypothetical protein